MPSINTRDRPDIDDIADEFVRSIEDEKVREALYQVTEKLKAIIEYQQLVIEDLYEAVTTIEDELP